MMIFGLWKIKSRSVSYKGIEDKAIRFAKKYVCGNCNMNCKHIDLRCECVRFYINAFQDGYKEASEPKWHKVAAGDLPKDGRIVSDQEGNNVKYVKHCNKWFYRHRSCEADVITWCEIPKYTEE